MTTATAVVLPAQLRHEAAAVSARLADALREPPPSDTDGDLSPSSPRWRGQSLSKGAAGVAVLHGLRARAGLGGTETVHAWLQAATREPLSAGGGAGLWYGATAVAFGMLEAAPGRYERELQQLDLAVARLVRARLQVAHTRIDAGAQPPLSEFDLVRGMAGLGAYLLRRKVNGSLLRQVLEYMVRLTEPVPARDDAEGSVPGWWTGDVPSGWDRVAVEGGHADLGMAHGIAGPLALVALAARAGITVDGHAEAIEKITAWLEAWRQDSPAGPWWPERVTSVDVRAGRSAQEGARRPSWCYGTPGIARALQLATIATDDHCRQERAEDALARCLAAPVQLARLSDPAVCHGWAGVFATARHAAADARSGALADHLPHLLTALLESAEGGRLADDQIGLIEGRAGIAAVLHSAATGTGGWETCLLIN
ncbi:lanthionine synthetase [Streptomyces sp. p1417]|uniref:Lanthionine synthetase n=1 Tax=Streptomyces typhae TaxID=2681492 RepID=A0A6L6XAD9_9ACTN|nr:lanthionine synthetase C family protein [Streptomyces typhae]MVO90766.1 lanthionine synthetase [Streptomyces typhae]